MTYDCLVVGGGPAGLSAALMLGRCRRRVLVCDTGLGRNRWTGALHGYLTRDGVAPAEFLRLARSDLRPYDTVELRTTEVVDAACVPAGFELRCADGEKLRGRTLLLATGLVDEIPSVPGLAPMYGRSAHHCPYCDAWEWRGQPIAIYGRGDSAAGLALGLTVWSGDLLLCTDGPAGISGRMRSRLDAVGIPVREERILRLDGRDGWLERVVFQAGPAVERRALFFSAGRQQASELPMRLGCRFTEAGVVDTGSYESTNVPGLYVCGDASRDAQFVVVAAAEGAGAALAINKSLLEADLAQNMNSKPSRTSRGAP